MPSRTAVTEQRSRRGRPDICVHDAAGPHLSPTRRTGRRRDRLPRTRSGRSVDRHRRGRLSRDRTRQRRRHADVVLPRGRDPAAVRGGIRADVEAARQRRRFLRLRREGPGAHGWTDRRPDRDARLQLLRRRHDRHQRLLHAEHHPRPHRPRRALVDLGSAVDRRVLRSREGRGGLLVEDPRRLPRARGADARRLRRLGSRADGIRRGGVQPRSRVLGLAAHRPAARGDGLPGLRGDGAVQRGGEAAAAHDPPARRTRRSSRSA